MNLFENFPPALPKKQEVDLADFGYKKYTLLLVCGTGYMSRTHIAVHALNEEQALRHPEVQKFLRNFPNGTVEIKKIE